ncbi:MAG: acetyltransferase [Candidatus Cloacimonetes bacterium]|nr:acetyltransferase [Candidatus Cloacimonadota bacterium]
MKNLVVFGTSGHARVCIDIIRLTNEYEIAGLLDKYLPLNSERFELKVIGNDADLPDLIQHYNLENCFIAIGDNSLRAKVAESVRKAAPKLLFPAIIHPSACVAKDVIIGTGTVVMAGTVINPGTTIGDFCIINTGAVVDHDCNIGSYSSIAPGSILGGNVNIGKYSAVSLGANIIHGKVVGSHTVIGASAVVLKNIPDNVVAYGNPCQIVRHRKEGDKYL